MKSEHIRTGYFLTVPKAILDAGLPAPLAVAADLQRRSTGFVPGADLASRYSILRSMPPLSTFAYPCHPARIRIQRRITSVKT
ncbi:MAG: hypothetical protein LBK99_16040 [Opitutaceae bacterium]|nr:hypothetical protein [Opitutaceae bacterium]